MAYMEFKPVVRKVNLKPKGVVEIVLETSLDDVGGKLDTLGKMIDCRTEASLDSLVVSYNVQINTKTNRPIVEYKVDESGVVTEVKPEGEQLEMNLEGIPPEKVQTKEEPAEADRELVDEFILSGLAPRYDDLPYDFYDIIRQKNEGITYLKIASELGISSGKLADMLDEYRKRVAPLALKWDEWRKSKAEPPINPEPENQSTEGQAATLETDSDNEQDTTTDEEDGDETNEGAA